MAVFNMSDVYALPVTFQAQGVEFSSNWYEQISTHTIPPPSEMCRQRVLQSSQQQSAYSLVLNESLNRPTEAPCCASTPDGISQYPGNQYARYNSQYSQKKRISELMVNIMSTLAERKPLSIDLDLKTLYRDAFAILEPATVSTVLAVWEVYIDSTQPTMYEDNGRSYKLSLNCPYEFRKDVIGVFLDILLKYFGQSQLVFLRKLSHALRCIEIDQFDERVLQWSIALRELEFLGIVA